MSSRARSSSPSARSRSNSPVTVDRNVPMPENYLKGQAVQRSVIREIVTENPSGAGGETKVDPGDVGRHLELLESDFILHRKNKEGVTTRAVWLDWEGNRDRYIRKEIVPSKLADIMTGSLWKRKQGGNAFSSPWVRRDFTAEMIPGSISYIAEKNVKKTMWLVSGCILHRLEGVVSGRTCAFRIVWPSGFDLILAADDAPACALWYEYLSAVQCPTQEILQARYQKQRNPAQAIALQACGIRSQKFRELVPFGVNKLYLRIMQSVSDNFKLLEDEHLFAQFGKQLEFAQLLDPVGEARKWGAGYPLRRYTNLPEIHYASLPSMSPYCEAWEALSTMFPTRHQEELRRFLVDAHFNVQKAADALRKHIEWRAKWLPLNPKTFIKELSKGKCFVHGIDHYGHPILYYFTHRQDPITRSIDEAIRAVVYRLEQAIARMPNRDGKVTIVVIREGAQAKNRDIDLVLPLSKVLQENYPERLHACVVYPAGVIFRTYLSVAGGTALSSDTIARVIPVADKSDLKYYVPIHCLLDRLGGIDHYDFTQDCQRQGSPILLPPLWATSEAKDYYPPPTDEADWSLPPLDPLGVDLRGKVDFVCPNCAARNCKLCRASNTVDGFYDDWQPLDLSSFPDPVV